MIRRNIFATVALATFLLGACSGGPVRRVSEPSASIQQLTVHTSGTWSVDLRLQNYSSVPMRFDRVRLELEVDGLSAGILDASPGLSVGPESADVTTLPFTPKAEARMVLADALSSRRSLPYSLKGPITATPEEGKPRDFDISSHSTLNPVPGLDGVLR